MKFRNFALLALMPMVIVNRVHAAETQVSLPVAGTKLQVASPFKTPKKTILSLVRTDRAPREWKFLKLKPGKVTSHFYTELEEDGSTITREADHIIYGVKDDRPLDQSHPNLHLIIKAGEASIPGLVGTLVGLNGRRSN